MNDEVLGDNAGACGFCFSADNLSEPWFCGFKHFWRFCYCATCDVLFFRYLERRWSKRKRWELGS